MQNCNFGGKRGEYFLKSRNPLIIQEKQISYGINDNLCNLYVNLKLNLNIYIKNFIQIKNSTKRSLIKLYYDLNYDLKNYQYSIELSKILLEIDLNTLGENHLLTSETYFSLGDCYQKLCDYQQSLIFYEKSLAITKEILGDDHQCISTVYN